MSNLELKEEIEQQVAALIHIASSCGDQGVAICIENVCWKLEELVEKTVDCDDGVLLWGPAVCPRTAMQDPNKFVEYISREYLHTHREMTIAERTAIARELDKAFNDMLDQYVAMNKQQADQ